MKRLTVGLSVGGAIALFVAVIIGFIPNGSCGSYLAPLTSYATQVPIFDGSGDWRTTDIPCDGGGYPTMFWTFIWVGIIFLVAAIVVHQVFLHNSDRSPRAPKPVRAAVYVSTATNHGADNHKSTDSLVEQIAKLNELYQGGVLSAEEFANAKARLLRDGS